MKDQQFDKRRNTAADAKKALLEKFRAKNAELESTFEERTAAAIKLREEREARIAERQAAKEAAERAEREESERAAREAAEARSRKENEDRAKITELLAAQKAARDARYAARKARHKR